MKKTALILAFLVCLINYQGFAAGLFEKKPQKLDENIATKDDLKKMGESIITSMNEEFKKRAAVTPVPVPPGGGVTVNPPNQETSDRIPVDRKIANFLLEDDKNSSGLKFYLSEAIVVKIYEAKETAEIQNINNKIVINNPQSPDTPKSTTEFSKDSEGVINGFGPANDRGRQIKIRFPDKGDRTLIFTRNAQKDNYELTEVEVLDDKTRRVDSIVTIQLMVSGSNDRKTELKVIPAEYAYMNNQQADNINNNFSYYNASTPQPNANYNRAVNTSRRVMSAGSTNPQRVIAFARKKNLALSNSNIVIINEYFNEARYEGVNIDLAIAQMLYATDYFRNREVMATCNYGGLSGASFQNWTIGVRAHIQHLKAYARQRPNRELVDPRFSLAWERGSFGITFDQVYPIWSQRPNYRQNIEEILRNL
jgi:hypothetical protein